MADQKVTDSIFTKIILRQIPASIRYEDDEFIAIDDIHPAAPIHILLIPKKPYQQLEEVDVEDEHFHARLLILARKIAKQVGIADNYKLFMNVGKRVQLIHHIHMHITGGWPATTKQKDLAASSKKMHDDGL